VTEGEAIPSFSLEDEVFAKLAKLAQSKKAYLHLGSVPLRMGSGVYNASVIITDQGELQTSYQKIHIFDIQLEGQKPIRESDVFQHGQSTNSFEIDGWKIGQSICYDLRFSELYSQYAKEGVDLILVPSAFLVKTGEAHWEVLLRARAIESQCYVVASAQAGKHLGRNGTTRETFGHSLVVEPWGHVAEKLSAQQKEVRVVALDKTKIQKARTQIPMAEHRRISR
jgi:predicted amidohydrolase